MVDGFSAGGGSGWVDGEKVLSIMHIIIRLRSFTDMNKTNHFFIFPSIVWIFLSLTLSTPRRPFLCLLLMTGGQWLGSAALFPGPEDFSRLSSIFDDTTDCPEHVLPTNERAGGKTSGSGVKNRQFEVLDINIIPRHLSRVVSSVAGEIWRAWNKLSAMKRGEFFVCSSVCV